MYMSHPLDKLGLVDPTTRQGNKSAIIVESVSIFQEALQRCTLHIEVPFECSPSSCLACRFSKFQRVHVVIWYMPRILGPQKDLPHLLFCAYMCNRSYLDHLRKFSKASWRCKCNPFCPSPRGVSCLRSGSEGVCSSVWKAS